jgi:hypothetical protein
MSDTSKLAQAFGTTHISKDTRKKSKVTVTKIIDPEEEEWQQERKKDYPHAVIYIKNGVVYVPSVGKDPNRVLFNVEPIYTSLLEVSRITENLKKVFSEKPKHLTMEETLKLLTSKKPKDQPMLQATKSTSLLNLRKTSISYMIQAENKGKEWIVFFYIPRKRYFDTRFSQTFPIDTRIEKLVEVILEDAKKYPHALQQPSP